LSQLPTGREEAAPVSRWLFTGQGFSLLVLILSTALGFLIFTYTSRQQQEHELLSGRIAALSAIDAETAANLERAQRNVKGLRDAVGKRGVFPGLEQYAVTTWNSVASSRGLITLSPKTFVALASLYDALQRENRDYSVLQDHLLLFPLQVRTLSKAELDVQESNRVSTLRSMLWSATILSTGTIPGLKEVVASELGVAKSELATVEQRLATGHRVGIGVGIGAGLLFTFVLVLAIIEVVGAIRQAIRHLESTKAPVSPADTDKSGSQSL
jgi:hypothetical protein